jgi:hypothetical protein
VDGNFGTISDVFEKVFATTRQQYRQMLIDKFGIEAGSSLKLEIHYMYARPNFGRAYKEEFA